MAAGNRGRRTGAASRAKQEAFEATKTYKEGDKIVYQGVPLAFDERFKTPFTDNMNTEKGGVKNDLGKIRFDLSPVEAEVAVARVLTKGAIKYTDRNWEKGIRYGRCYAAARRHMAEFWNGNSWDEETGEHVLAHAICMLQFMLTYELRGMGHVADLTGGCILDDRPGNTSDVPMNASIPLEQEQT